MNKEDIRSGLESGRNHPFPLLQHLHREGEVEAARFVAEEGHRYLQGRERLGFNSLVRELFPDIREDAEQERKQRLEEHRAQNASAFGAALRERMDEKKARGRGPMPRGGGWSMPLDVPRQ